MLNNQNNPIIYGSTSYAPINDQKYKNTSAEVGKYGGKYGPAIEIGFNDTSVGKRTHQSRKGDTDIGHIAALAADIENVGLQQLPEVEWNAMSQKFDMLTGYHRDGAIKKLGWSKLPARVVEFGDPIQREYYIQHKNNHRPCKAHTQDDAVEFINKLKIFGVFAGLSQKEIKNLVYAKLTAFYPRLHTNKKKAVLNRAFNWQIIRYKEWQKTERYDEMRRSFGLTGKVESGMINGDVCYISSKWNAAEKAIYKAAIARATAHEKQESSTPLAIRVQTYFDVTAADMDPLRTEALNSAGVANRTLFNSGIVEIAEISFLHQKLAPLSDRENVPLVYTWDKREQKFVQD